MMSAPPSRADAARQPRDANPDRMAPQGAMPGPPSPVGTRPVTEVADPGAKRTAEPDDASPPPARRHGFLADAWPPAP